MISFFISAIKIIFLLGFLIGIHESGHFIVAKLCKVKVNEFAIGFGPKIWEKQGVETKYALRLIPLGGFVSMEGEEEYSEENGSFSKASVPRRVAIVAAGAMVNIIFALIIYFSLAVSFGGNIEYGVLATKEFVISIVDNLKQLFIGKVTTEQLMGPVGISEVVAKTNGLKEFVYMLALVSMSLGVTNLIPFPPLDGGKILMLIVEGIRRKPLNQELEAKIQLLGFAILITLSVYVTYNDVLRIL